MRVICNSSFLLLLGFFNCSPLLVSSFTFQGLPRPPRAFVSTSRLASTVVQEASDVAETTSTAPTKTRIAPDGRVQMNFLGRKTVSTEPVSLPSDMEMLNEFFKQEKHRNLLFFRNEATNVPYPSAEQMKKWSEEAKLAGGIADFDGFSNDQVIQMKAYLNLPGLKVLSASTIGAKLLLPGMDHYGREIQYPEYQFTLLDSQLTPQGPAPLVWLFNKLTKYRDTTSSFTRVRAMNAGGANGDKIVFRTEARLEARIRIPRVALKFLPVDVERFERQGSEAVQKLLEKELEPAIQGFRDAYQSWISS